MIFPQIRNERKKQKRALLDLEAKLTKVKAEQTQLLEDQDRITKELQDSQKKQREMEVQFNEEMQKKSRL